MLKTKSNRIFSEYIVQVKEDMPGTCIHEKKENIIKCNKCKYLKKPKSKNEPFMCQLHKKEIALDYYCYWAEYPPYFTNY